MFRVFELGFRLFDRFLRFYLHFFSGFLRGVVGDVSGARLKSVRGVGDALRALFDDASRPAFNGVRRVGDRLRARLRRVDRSILDRFGDVFHRGVDFRFALRIGERSGAGDDLFGRDDRKFFRRALRRSDEPVLRHKGRDLHRVDDVNDAVDARNVFANEGRVAVFFGRSRDRSRRNDASFKFGRARQLLRRKRFRRHMVKKNRGEGRAVAGDFRQAVLRNLRERFVRRNEDGERAVFRQNRRHSGFVDQIDERRTFRERGGRLQNILATLHRRPKQRAERQRENERDRRPIATTRPSLFVDFHFFHWGILILGLKGARLRRRASPVKRRFDDKIGLLRQNG